PDGSDFLVPGVPGIIQSASANCSGGFDMDTVVFTLKNPLPPGNYSIQSQVGTDGNTLLDNCGTPLAVGATVPFVITPVQPTPMDSITPVACAPNVLQLVFKKPMLCSSIAADGSDFKVTGPAGTTVASASGNCVNGLSSVVYVSLSAPVVVGGTYRITLVTGSDGNTLIDQCGQQTPALSFLDFAASDTVSAQFTAQLQYGCLADTVVFSYTPANGVNQWLWNFDDQTHSGLEDVTKVYTVFGQKQVQHIVSNGVCSDTLNAVVMLGNALHAAFQAPDVVCPKDQVSFTDSSTGNIINWNWDFGDGSNSSQTSPLPHLFPNTSTEKNYTVTLVVENNIGCYDTAVKVITKLQSCYITVPNAFTPNGDGKNDYLYPLNAYKAVDLLFRVYNRYGQLVFETRDWTKKWDGTINGVPQDTGVFVWMLQYTDGDSGKRFFQKGTTVLIR
ncbi:MAG TPA: PKD domain-containing protein, partial [Puia sp.]|nr:PKD domain-containing protein [Puia sp.]